MNLHKRLDALFHSLALGGCASLATEQGQVPTCPIVSAVGHSSTAMSASAIGHSGTAMSASAVGHSGTGMLGDQQRSVPLWTRERP